jgi:hypothetical protein
MFTIFSSTRSLLIALSLTIALTAAVTTLGSAQERTMMQGFYWDATPGGVWYDTLAHYSEALAQAYLNQINGTPTTGAIFDFNLRFAYKEMSDGCDNYDIRALYSRGLMHSGVPYERIVTFVENGDFARPFWPGNTTTDPRHVYVAEHMPHAV